jgi:hypothetical protein
MLIARPQTIRRRDPRHTCNLMHILPPQVSILFPKRYR